MSRLTNGVRERILINLVKQSPFKDKLDAVRAEIAVLGVEELKSQWSEYQETMDKLPDDFFQVSYSFYLRLDRGQGSTGPYISLKDHNLPNLIVPKSFSNWPQRDICASESGPALKKAYKKYMKIDAERSQLKKDANRILISCTTLKKLLEAWPEVEGLIPAYFLKGVSPTALAIIPKELIASVNKNIKKQVKA